MIDELMWPAHIYAGYDGYLLFGLVGLGLTVVLLGTSIVLQLRRTVFHPVLTVIALMGLFWPVSLFLVGDSADEEMMLSGYIILYGCVAWGILGVYFFPKRKPWHIAWIVPLVNVLSMWSLTIGAMIVASI